jgi:hypothetical protein
MSVAIPITTRADSHVAAGHAFGIGLYIEELEAMGYSPARIKKTLAKAGLLVGRKAEPSCQQIEAALAQLDEAGARSALCAFREAITDREARTRQLQCLRMRIEWRYEPSVYAMLISILKA